MAFRDQTFALEERLRALTAERDALNTAIEEDAAELRVLRGEAGDANAERRGPLLAIGVVVFLASVCVWVAAPIPGLVPARFDSTRTDARTIADAVITYRAEHAGGVCPTVEDLVVGDYFDDSRRLLDAWDQPFRIVCDGEDVTVISPGPDGVPDTDDDIDSSSD